MKTKIEEGAAWTKKAGKNPKGGLNQKGVDSYKKENPGSKLKTAVTTKPSKLKKGSKSANRRKSFCARMGGMRKRQKDSNNTGKDRLSLSLKKWNCSTDINKEGMPTMSERQIKLENARIELAERCWSGYEPTPGKKAYSKGSCQPKGSSKKKKKVAEARDYLGEKVLEAFQKGMKDAARALQKKHSEKNPGKPKMRNQAAVDQAARAQADAGIKKAQGKNTPSSVFGKEGTQDSTTAFGGSAGSEEDKKNRTTPDKINRSRSDNPGQVFTRGGNQKSKKPAAFGTSRRAVNRANQRSAKKNVSKYVDSMTKDLKHDDYT